MEGHAETTETTTTLRFPTAESVPLAASPAALKHARRAGLRTSPAHAAEQTAGNGGVCAARPAEDKTALAVAACAPPGSQSGRSPEISGAATAAGPEAKEASASAAVCGLSG